MPSSATGSTPDVLFELGASLVLWKRDGASWKSSDRWSAYTGGSASHGADAQGAARHTALDDTTLCCTVRSHPVRPILVLLGTLVERMHSRVRELL